MLSVLAASFNENLEPDQDANSALTELDKGLRSGKVGDQCESIVRFPKLFEKYPFPILINSSLLKLAEFFRTTNNFMRICVLRVCQQSEKHLDKLSNIDEFVRRLYSVIHSNDPVARALTLRMFGAIATIMPEREQVHHTIRRSLDSHDNVEVEAAIYAATQFAKISKTFAVSMCNKISDMIQGQATTASRKLQLIPILQYMHHDTNTSAMVRTLCLDLLPSYPSEDFVLVLLSTLTQLAATTLVDIPRQVSLLLNYLKTDPRWEVKFEALHHLYELAKPGAHIWPPGAIDELIDYIINSNRNKILMPGLCVLQVLVESPKLCFQHSGANTKLRELCAEHSYSPHPAIASQAIQILTQIMCCCFEQNLNPEGADDVTIALETLICFLTLSEQQQQPKHLKNALKCAVKLCAAKSAYCENFVDLLGSRLDNVDGEYSVVICETLGAIGGLKSKSLLPQLETVLTLLSSLNAITNPTNLQTRIKIILCTLIFQIMSCYKWNEQTQDAIFRTLDNNDGWSNYCIGRNAVRFGHHHIGTRIFKQLTKNLSSENFHYWLVCLTEMTQAEASLYGEDTAKLVQRIEKAVVHYHKAIAALKAASSPLESHAFQIEYMRIRAEFLQCLSQLIYTCNMLCIVPPPAIATAIVQNTRDDHQRHGYITNQMRKCVTELKTCGELHLKLYQTAFNADPGTLENMQILYQMCVLAEQCVETVCVNGSKIPDEFPEFLSKKIKQESDGLANACEMAMAEAVRLIEDSLTSTISHKQIELLKKIVLIFTNACLPIPRFYFQTLQSTSLKLAVSPQPRVMGEFISVQAGSQLAVKVEGVIQHGDNAGLFRKFEQVVIDVTSQLQSAPKNQDVDPKILEEVSLLTQTVTPHNDFFTAQFLLDFPRGGQYLLSIEASLIDESSNSWKTGQHKSLTVKVPEEQKLPPINFPGISSNSNAILMPEDSLFIKPYQKKPN